MELRLLNKYIDDGQTQLTNDSLVTYDWLTEEFIVDIDEYTIATISGGNRRIRAKELANLIRSGIYGKL